MRRDRAPDSPECRCARQRGVRHRRIWIIGVGTQRCSTGAPRQFSQVAPQRLPCGVGGSPRYRTRRRDDRIAAQPRLLRRAIEVDEQAINCRLVGGIAPEQCRPDDGVEIGESAVDAKATEAPAAVTAIERLAGPG